MAGIDQRVLVRERLDRTSGQRERAEIAELEAGVRLRADQHRAARPQDGDVAALLGLDGVVQQVEIAGGHQRLGAVGTATKFDAGVPLFVAMPIAAAAAAVLMFGRSDNTDGWG